VEFRDFHGAPEMAELRLLKVPRWLSEQWLNSKPHEIVADLDLENGTLRTCGARSQNFRVERRASPELFSFWQPTDGSEVPIEGPILESLTIIPGDVKDTGYRNLLQQRSQETETAMASARSRYEETIIKTDEPPPVTRNMAKAAPAKAAETSFEEVTSLVEAALKAAHPKGLTGAELCERLPARGCTLAQLRDALLALAVPSQDGERRYIYSPGLGRAKNGEMLRWNGDVGGEDEGRLTTGHLKKRPRT